MNDFINPERIEAETAALKLELLALQGESEKIKQRINNIDQTIQAAIKKATESKTAESSTQTKYVKKSENRPSYNDSVMGIAQVKMASINHSINSKPN